MKRWDVKYVNTIREGMPIHCAGQPHSLVRIAAAITINPQD